MSTGILPNRPASIVECCQPSSVRRSQLMMTRMTKGDDDANRRCGYSAGDEAEFGG